MLALQLLVDVINTDADRICILLALNLQMYLGIPSYTLVFFSISLPQPIPGTPFSGCLILVAPIVYLINNANRGHTWLTSVKQIIINL